MTDLASLGLRIDSTQVKTGVNELDKLTAAGTRAQGAVERLGDEAVTTGAKMRASAVAASQMAAQAQAMAARTTGMGNSSRLASHHLQNLSFQVNDLVVGIASGAPVMTVFMQQGAQIAQIMAQAGVGVGGMVKQVAAMVGGFIVANPLILAAGVAAGGAAIGIAAINREANNGDPVRKYAESLGLTAKQMRQLDDVTVTTGDTIKAVFQVAGRAIWENIRGPVTAVSTFMSTVFAQIGNAAKGTFNLLIGAAVGSYRAIIATWQRWPAAIGDLFFSGVNMAIDAINSLVQKSVEGMNVFIRGANTILAKVGFDGVIPEIGAPQIAKLKNQYAGAAKEVADSIRAVAQEAMGTDFLGEGWDRFSSAVAGQARQNAMNRVREQAEGLGFFDPKTGGRTRSRASGKSEMEKALEDAQRFIEALDQETARIGKTAIEIKRLEVEAAAAAAQNAGLGELAQRIREAGAAWETATRDAADADFQANIIQPLKDEYALLGLVGPERERAALALQETAFKAKALKDGVTDVNAAWAEYVSWQTKIIEGKSALERDADAAARLADYLQDVASMLGSFGGFGGILAGFVDLINPGSRLFKAVNQPEDQVAKQIEAVAKQLEGAFGIGGSFGKALAGALSGASIGGQTAAAFGGNAQIGALQGGVLQLLGVSNPAIAAFSAGTAISNLVGPSIGKMLGIKYDKTAGSVFGLIGGLIGGLFSKPAYGTASLTSATGDAALRGRAGGERDAGTAAGQVQSGLAGIAERLGASLGSFAVSIGTFDGNWRVSTTGFGGSLDSKNARGQGLVDFGEDSVAAIQFAIRDAIRDGALQGLSAGAQALLANNDDLEAGLSKALRFQGVFDDLQALTDPLGAAMGKLNKEFDQLRAIFEEAGATAADYAALEQLYQMRRETAAVDALRDRREMEIRILELTGRETEALAASRELELLSLTASLRPLQQMIYTLEDANAVIAKFTPLADDLRSFRSELIGGQSTASLAFLQEQFRTTADLAAQGDAGALGKLRGVSTSYLDSVRLNARTALEYQNALGEVLASVDQGIFAADAQIEYAQLQIDAIKQNSNILASIREEMNALQTQVVENTGQMARMWTRFEGDGLTVRTADDTPLRVEVIEP